MDFKQIFEKYNSIAVFGMSTNPAKPAHYVPAYLMEKGYKVYPINPAAAEIAGVKAFKTIDEVDGEIDILNVFRPSAEAAEVVSMAAKRHKEKGDIKLIWLQDGIISDEARQIAEDNGMEFIQNECMFREHKRL